MWKDRGLPGKVIDITPDIMSEELLLDSDLNNDEVLYNRGCEIKGWLTKYGDDVSHYVILDDMDDILPEQQIHFVWTDPDVGITKEDAEQAIMILKNLEEKENGNIIYLEAKKVMKMRKRTICIDFDGVIHDYSKGWRGVDVYDKPIKGTKEGLQKLKKDGWTIIIFTTRNDSPKLREFLKDNGLVFDYINENPDQPVGSEYGKLLADIYLDDKGITFDGDWNKSINAIQNFKTWQKGF